jgi:hypothetical protein
MKSERRGLQSDLRLMESKTDNLTSALAAMRDRDKDRTERDQNNNAPSSNSSVISTSTGSSGTNQQEGNRRETIDGGGSSNHHKSLQMRLGGIRAGGGELAAQADKRRMTAETQMFKQKIQVCMLFHVW